MAYTVNFPQVSNCETWFDTYALVAADDLTPIDSTLDNIVLTMQVWPKLGRSGADQSQTYAYWPLQLDGIMNYSPIINTSTNDGTGQLTLSQGLIQINIPLATMNMLLAGYYMVGFTMQNSDVTKQLIVGLMPVYDGGITN